MRARAVSVGFLILPLALFGACGDKKAEGKKGSIAAGKNTDDAKRGKPKKVSARLSMRSWRPLLNEALRAELDIGGLAIDFGTSDQHKYTRGGWATGWGEAGNSSEGSTFARTSAALSKLNFWLRSEPKEVVLRVRTAEGKAETGALRIDVGKNTIAKSLAVSKEWQVIRAPIEAGKAALGRVQLALHSKERLDVDWMWLPDDADAGEFSNLPRTLPIKFDNGSRRALAAPSSRAFSFYLHVPPASKLIVDVGSDQDATFTISAQTSGGTQELLKQTTSKGEWQEQVVDLSSLAGQAIRLELRSDAAMGKTGWGEPEIMIAAGGPTAKPGKRAKNLVYVVMDTTRADSFASVDEATIVQTPVYDALAKKSTTFRNAYNNENWTKPSVTTMWSGLYPETHGARQATSHVADEIRFLPQQLEENGFVTGAFIANAVVSETFGFDKGWTHFQNDSDHNTNGNGSMLYPNAAKWMEEHKDERFFLYVQSVDPHTTYDVPEDYRRKYYQGEYKGQLGTAFDREEQMVVDNGKMKITDDDLAWIWALYRGEVTYQDRYLGDLINKIDELGLAEDTLIVITNDHGEEIRDHGAMGHGWPLFEEQIRAPLLMSYAPIFNAGRNIKAIIEHADLAPTILDALGVAPMKSAEGMSFLPFIEDGVGKRQHPFYTVAWSRKGTRSVRVGDWKLIAGKGSGWMNLYNLADDPQEKKSLVKKGKAPQEEALLPGRLCEIYLSETLATPDKARRQDGAGQKQRYNSQEIPIDEKTRKELEALGYL